MSSGGELAPSANTSVSDSVAKAKLQASRVLPDDGPARDDALFRMFSTAAQSEDAEQAGSVKKAATTPGQDIADAKVSLAAVAEIFSMLGVGCRVGGAVDDAVKASIAEVTLNDVDFSRMTFFEAVAQFDKHADERCVDFDGFATCFDDQQLPTSCMATVQAGFGRLRALRSTQRDLAATEQVARKALLDLEREGRASVFSLRRREIDVARLREQIHLGTVAHRRARQLDEMTGHTASADGGKSVSAQSEALKKEIEAGREEQRAVLADMTKVEEACGAAERAAAVNGEKLQVLRRWFDGAMLLARQQVEEDVAAVIADVNTKRPEVDDRLAACEAHLARAGAALMANATAKSLTRTKAAIAACRRSRPAVGDDDDDDDVFEWVARENRFVWDLAVAMPLDHPDLPLCDPWHPMHGSSSARSALSQELTCSLVYLFRSYCDGDAAEAAAMDASQPAPSMLRSVGPTMMLKRDGFCQLLRDHAIDCPGSPELTYDDAVSAATQPGSYPAPGMTFDAFMQTMHSCAQNFVGPLSRRISGTFALHCLVASGIHPTQPRLLEILARQAESDTAYDPWGRAARVATEEDARMRLVASSFALLSRASKSRPPSREGVSHADALLKKLPTVPDALVTEFTAASDRLKINCGPQSPVSLGALVDVLSDIGFELALERAAEGTGALSISRGQQRMLALHAVSAALVTVTRTMLLCSAGDDVVFSAVDFIFGCAPDALVSLDVAGISASMRTCVPFALAFAALSEIVAAASAASMHAAVPRLRESGIVLPYVAAAEVSGASLRGTFARVAGL